jgi:hypothetical protein
MDLVNFNKARKHRKSRKNRHAEHESILYLFWDPVLIKAPSINPPEQAKIILSKLNSV